MPDEKKTLNISDSLDGHTRKLHLHLHNSCRLGNEEEPNGCVFNRESPCVRTVLRVCFNTARFLLVMFLISTWRVLCKFVMV
jgi:hypothetical protein